MSSACVCHLDEYCFYCDMYLPLEQEKARLEVELEIAVRIIKADAEFRKEMSDYLLKDLERLTLLQKDFLRGKRP